MHYLHAYTLFIPIKNLRWRKEQKMDTIHSEDWVRLRLPGLWKKLKSTTLASKYSTEKNKVNVVDFEILPKPQS